MCVRSACAYMEANLYRHRRWEREEKKTKNKAKPSWKNKKNSSFGMEKKDKTSKIHLN